MTLVLALTMIFAGSSVFAGTDPVEKTLSYSGNTITAASYDGYALIDYPDSIPEGDVEAFLAYEVGLYPADAAAVVYSFPEEGVLRLDYPEGLSETERSAFLDTFLSDITAFAPEECSEFAIEPYGITVKVYASSADILYPGYITGRGFLRI